MLRWTWRSDKGGIMREKLELKIVAIVAVLLLIGIFAAGFMVLTIEKKSLYSITGVGAEATAKIIAKDVERVMLEGRADLTKTLVDDLKGASGIEKISVFNFQGREAFNKDAPADRCRYDEENSRDEDGPENQ